MTTTPSTATTFDGGLIRFEVRDGIRRIGCTVSDEALEAVSGLAVPSTMVSRRKSFDRFRMLINAAARLKLGTLPPGFAGPLALSSKDLRCVPPEVGFPSFGSTGRTA
jgi:Protein of unknown function (DUF1488)